MSAVRRKIRRPRSTSLPASRRGRRRRCPNKAREPRRKRLVAVRVRSHHVVFESWPNGSGSRSQVRPLPSCRRSPLRRRDLPRRLVVRRRRRSAIRRLRPGSRCERGADQRQGPRAGTSAPARGRQTAGSTAHTDPIPQQETRDKSRTAYFAHARHPDGRHYRVWVASASPVR